MKYSLIIPVYNRPNEVDELLQSLLDQRFKDFEVIVVEDGSSVPCTAVIEKYARLLPVRYFTKPNSGPGQTRNYGAERSNGEYLIVLDSDCILPPGYLEAVEEELNREPADAFGGPDRAHESFSDVQKAINYAMTSFFTTGGIRGGKRRWTSFTHGVSTWVSRLMCTGLWVASQKCVSAKISISVSVSLKGDTGAGCSRELGFGINAGRI